MKTIKVTGKGKLAVRPDRIRLLITQQSTEKTYNGAIKESAARKGALNDLLAEAGFEKTDLKTLSFSVDTQYESYQGRDKAWKQRLIGYQYTHYLKIEFDADNKTLGKVLSKVAKCSGAPEFSIEYTIADTEAAKNELLAKAVADSREKAHVLANAAQVKLGEILSIDYSWEEIEFVARPMSSRMMKSCMENDEGCGIGLDIEADDISVTDTVTILWEICD